MLSASKNKEAVTLQQPCPTALQHYKMHLVKHIALYSITLL